jgi:hypothetical protein
MKVFGVFKEQQKLNIETYTAGREPLCNFLFLIKEIILKSHMTTLYIPQIARNQTYLSKVSLMT